MKGNALKAWSSALIFSLSLTACGVEDASEDIKEGAITASEKIAQAADKLALAVPGERMLRLWEATHSTDDKVREEAQKLAAAMFAYSPGDEYDLWVSFRFDPAKQLRAQMRYSRVGDEQELRGLLLSGATSLHLQPMQASLPKLRSREDIEKEVNQKARSFLAKIMGSPQVRRGDAGLVVEMQGGFVLAQNPVGPHPYGDENMVYNANVQLDGLADSLAQVALSEFDQKKVPATGDFGFVRPWSPFKDIVLTILIHDDDWNALNGKLEVFYGIRSRKDPARFFAGSGERELPRAVFVRDFEGNEKPPLQDKAQGISIRWASVNLMDQWVDLEEMKHFREFEAALQELNRTARRQ